MYACFAMASSAFAQASRRPMLSLASMGLLSHKISLQSALFRKALSLSFLLLFVLFYVVLLCFFSGNTLSDMSAGTGFHWTLNSALTSQRLPLTNVLNLCRGKRFYSVLGLRSHFRRTQLASCWFCLVNMDILCQLCLF